MTRLLVSAAAAMILSVSPTLAADNAADNRAAGSDQSTGPKQQSSARCQVRGNEVDGRCVRRQLNWRDGTEFLTARIVGS